MKKRIQNYFLVPCFLARKIFRRFRFIAFSYASSKPVTSHSPISQTVTLKSAEEPTLWVADLIPFIQQQKKGLLYDIFRIFGRDEISRKYPLNTKLYDFEKFLETDINARRSNPQI